ncbi:hypothetical protein [Bradyrhizobium sp.]|uniref:hypothetical protein n=1 Tax=Bradyrhizobium sp. TaxID=376 RepID=UPI0039E5786A
MVAKILLTAQEVEFAIACKHFFSEVDRIGSEKIEIAEMALIVPSSDQLREAFLVHGVARLMKVFQLAIENQAIPLAQVPGVISGLASFNEKLMTSLMPMPGLSKH